MFKRRRQTGLTLVEMIVTIVVLAIALVSISQMLRGGLGRSADALIQLRSVSLAQAYLDEILGKRYDERTRPRGIPPCRSTAPPPGQCTPEASFGANYASPIEPTENSRSKLDDVDDYHNLNEGFGTGNDLEDAEGNPRSGYENYTVNVNVRYINVGMGEEEESFNVNNELDDEYDAKLITVTISHSAYPQDFIYAAYKANF